MWSDGDTIAAIATPQGTGALAVVRISGPKAAEVVSLCFESKNFDSEKSHQAFYGFWRDPVSKRALDEVLVLNFSSGRGFTGEASCEVICHGGVQVTELVLQAALRAGARLARPGEFTYRAVMNGKLDLSQAEAILDLIAARSPRAAELALLNIQGGLSQWLLKTESRVIKILAHLEASIDFTTEDIQPFEYPELTTQAKEALGEVSRILDTHMSTQLANQGVRVVLVGKPNVGKSSLLNTLVGRQKSIVTNVPGTTRDAIEVDILVNQNLIKLIDTAGLREAQDLVESLGIEKTQSEVRSADFVVYVLDASQDMESEDVEFLKNLDPERLLICFNKADLKNVDPGVLKKQFGISSRGVVKTSALDSQGVESLRREFEKFFSHSLSQDVDAVVGSQRQLQELKTCQQKLLNAVELLENRASQELISLEVQEALLALQNTLGKNPGDEILDQVFKDFCIGK